ncbi:hypothetical protein PHLCEN_2v8573 [Hermanssonia centrifuga]|uniref:Uncharacterized protein n=1 Tax=Hermanssonia centrifuga TaxID=98765 RepID=A0A2R6NTF1_9APHY|nr:hypothetical protein PHLCEN_2v8573 [Hermanssonia centrifuga]
MTEYTRDLTLPNIDALHLESSDYPASSDALTTRPHLHVVTQHEAYSFPAPWQSRPTPMASRGTLTEFSSGSEYSPSSSPAAPPSPNTFNPPSVQEPACVDPVTATPQPQAHRFSPHLAPHMFVREYHLDPLPTLTPTLVSHPGQSDGSNISPIGPARRTRTYTRSTPKSSVPSSSTGGDLPEDNPTLSPRTVSHPYTRIYAKRNSPPSKRRKMWNHALEKSLFTPDELANVSAPLRRTMYISSLEAHVDELHAQLLSLELYPVPFEKLEPYHGMNSKTAKSMVAGLYKDAAEMKTKLLELKRSVGHHNIDFASSTESSVD